MGRYLYDDGLRCTELSRLSIADNCTIISGTWLQTGCKLQQTYGSQHIVIERGVTLHSGAKLNCGTHVISHTSASSNAVVLGEETLAPNSVWQDNPAAPVA